MVYHTIFLKIFFFFVTQLSFKNKMKPKDGITDEVIETIKYNFQPNVL